MIYQVFSLSSWQWWWSLIWFVPAVVGSFFLPGLLLLSFFQLPKRLQFYLAPAIGIAVWGSLGYTLGWVGLRQGMYLLPVLAGVGVLLRRKKIFPLEWQCPAPWVVWPILLVGVVTQLVAVWGSGWRSVSGLTYYFVNTFDGLFHLSLSRMLVEHVPPFQPGAAGMLVTNYHYLSNLVIADLGRVWNLPLNHIYFQFLPLFLSVWMGLIILQLITTFTSQKSAQPLALLMYYFVGEGTWIFHYGLGKTSAVPFETFVDNGSLQFLNPPQAFAKIVFFSSLLLWFHFNRKPTVKLAMLLGLLIGTLCSFKIYFALTLVLIVGVHLSLDFAQRFLKGIQSHRISQILTQYPWAAVGSLIVTAGVIGAAFYLPTNAQAGGIFFDFLTWPKLWLGASKLNWNEWWLRLQVYEAAHNTRALIVWYGMAASFFLAAIYNIRLLSVLTLIPGHRGKLTWSEVTSLVVSVLIITTIGMNFLQGSGGANIFNFFVVGLTIANLLSAIFISSLPRPLFVLFSLLTFVMCTQTVQLQYFFLHNYAQHQDNQKISPSHEAALHFLAAQPSDHVFQTYPSHYLDFNTPYLYFFTGHQTFVGGRQILSSHGQPITERLDIMNKIFATSPQESASLATQVGITEVVLQIKESPEKNFATLATQSAWLTRFANDEVMVISPR